MRGAVTLLAGIQKIGKSLMLQQILSAVALGKPCLGLHTERARAFGYFCEDPDYWLIRRQFDINAALSAEMPDYDDAFSWVSHAASSDCVLAEFEYGKMRLTSAWDHLWREVDAQQSEIIGIDTAAAVFTGNENSRNQVTPFMRALQAKALEKHRAVVLCAHPTKSDPRGFSGSGAWLASARQGFSLQRPNDYDELTNTPANERLLCGLGTNYSAGPSTIRLRWREGVFEAVDPDLLPTRATSAKSLEVLAEEMLRGLYHTRTNGGAVPADVMMAGSLPRRYRKTFNQRTSLNDLYAAQDQLLARGDVVRVKVKGRCLLRPRTAAKYDSEEVWSV
jgi:RecA-family ATPase